MFEILDLYRVNAQEVFARAEAAARRAGLDSRFIYIPAGAPEDALDWLVEHLAPEETITAADVTA